VKFCSKIRETIIKKSSTNKQATSQTKHANLRIKGTARYSTADRYSTAHESLSLRSVKQEKPEAVAAQLESEIQIQEQRIETTSNLD
jgi:hypothetical protein